MALMTQETPEHWRHVRIVKEKTSYAVRTWFMSNPFGPVALAALGLPATEPTDKLTLKAAEAIGARIERTLTKQGRGGKQRGAG